MRTHLPLAVDAFCAPAELAFEASAQGDSCSAVFRLKQARDHLGDLNMTYPIANHMSGACEPRRGARRRKKEQDANQEVCDACHASKGALDRNVPIAVLQHAHTRRCPMQVPRQLGPGTLPRGLDCTECRVSVPGPPEHGVASNWWHRPSVNKIDREKERERKERKRER